MEIRQSYDCLISTMGFPILVRWHLYIESGPCKFRQGKDGLQGLCNIGFRPKLILISCNLVWPDLIYQLSTRFEILHRSWQCHCRDLCKIPKPIGQLKRMLWMNQIARDLSLRWGLDGYDVWMASFILHSIDLPNYQKSVTCFVFKSLYSLSALNLRVRIPS